MDTNMIFDNYFKIDFKNLSEKEREDVLKNIFKSNLGKYKNSLLKNYGDTDITDIISCLKNEYIHLYEHKFELDFNYNLDELSKYELTNKLKTKNENCHRAYIRAYSYFKSKGFNLKKLNSISTYFIINPIDLDDKKTSNLKGFVKCGEIEAYKILDNLTMNDYFWVFPVDIEDNINKCYLLKSTKEYKDKRYEYTKEAFLKFCKKK